LDGEEEAGIERDGVEGIERKGCREKERARTIENMEVGEKEGGRGDDERE
jgi:hypothetical protein